MTLEKNLRRIFCSFILALALLAALAPAVSLASTAEGQASTPLDELSEAAVEAIAEAESSDADGPTSLAPEILDRDISLTEFQHRLVPLTRQELKELAAHWLTVAREETEEVMAAQIAVDRTKGKVENEVQARVADLVVKRNVVFQKLDVVLSAWDKKGGDADLIAEYRAYKDAVMFDELRTSNFETLYREAVRWIGDPNGGRKFLVSLGWVLLALVGLWLVAKLVRRFVLGWLNRLSDMSRLLANFLSGLAFWLVMVVGLAIALSMLGMDVAPIFALIGGASFILAFAFQDTLGNFASGLMIMMNRPFDEGDVVDLGGVVGKVKAVTIVATTIVTADNQVIVLPNRNVWGNLIKNMTATDTRRVDLIFGISYEDSIDDALEIMKQVTLAHPAVLNDPEPVFQVHELADSSVNFICRPWVKTEDYWKVYWDLTQHMKKAFDEGGISIPFPQTDLHIRHLPRELRAGEAT